jgi:hypothetical protein
MDEVRDFSLRSRPAANTIMVLLVAFTVMTPSIAGSATGIPDPDQCFIPEVIFGTTPAAPCIVIVRDATGSPIPAALVELRFGPAIPHGADLCLWDRQIPPATYSCATYTISQVTNAVGFVAFDPLFGGHVNQALVEVAADGVVLGVAKARSTDFNGDGRCCLIDLAWLRYYYWHAPDAEQADFNNSGSVELGDLDAFRRGYFGIDDSPVCP